MYQLGVREFQGGWVAQYIITGFGLRAGWRVACPAGAAVAVQTKEICQRAKHRLAALLTEPGWQAGAKTAPGQAGSRPTRKHHGRYC